MLQGLNKFLFSVEISIFLPFFRRSPSTSIHLSERLELITYFNKEGRPRLYTVNKIRGGADGLFGTDTGQYIYFYGSPKPALRRVLIAPELPGKGVEISGYMWIWLLKKDELVLLAMDEWHFYFKPDEAESLAEALFDSAS